MATDIIIETLDSLIALLEANGGVFLPCHRSEAERIARAAWGGEKPYVPKLGESGQLQLSQRDRSIRREFARGAHISLLARRHGLTERRVRQIVSGDAVLGAVFVGPPAPPASTASETACLTNFQESCQPTQQRRSKRAAPA